MHKNTMVSAIAAILTTSLLAFALPKAYAQGEVLAQPPQRDHIILGAPGLALSASGAAASVKVGASPDCCGSTSCFCPIVRITTGGAAASVNVGTPALALLIGPNNIHLGQPGIGATPSHP